MISRQQALFLKNMNVKHEIHGIVSQVGVIRDLEEQGGYLVRVVRQHDE
jgi:hypothetical protein